MTGADAMVKCLEAQGIDVVFGYPGVAIAPFYNSLYDSKIQSILVRQEQNGGHAASGYARVTRKPAVCIATSGPGATNLITGIATAYADSIPMVAITGQVSTRLLGKDVFQEADITGACEPFVKYSYLVKNVEDIPRVFKEAFYIASTGRQGPVLIDVPIDIQKQEFEYEEPGEVSIRGYKPKVKGHIVQIKKVVEAIQKAKKPLICAGGGVVLGHAEPVIQEFCEKYSIPVVTTMMGVGSMPKRHPLFFGMLGTNGKPYANRAVAESDLLIIVGARVNDRSIGALSKLEQDRLIIHIDIDTAEIGKNIGPTIPLVGDARLIFESLMEYDIHVSFEDWVERLRNIKVNCVDYRTFHEGFINPCLFVEHLTERMDEDAIYVADVGQNQLWSADNYVMKKGRFLTTGGFGTMGYAIPAAIGAKMAAPHRQVVAVCGDGSFQMSMNELATMLQNHIKVKIIIMKNMYLGLVREYQYNNYDKNYIAVELGDIPNLKKIAEAYDMEYFHLRNMSKMDETIEAFLACDNSALFVCHVYKFDKVKE
ncbi:biosynthetic-type acetolactate synthase large subunit [Frisingicoccus caecimuris]|uniref:Acetolactate synthase n=1 Tax=Frisingicoccus caecimuris TaxID=1796636 RepID=A0A4R2LAR6_9FIRM|nr:biosynthetic-type acetolactate synthase large subunit [Frisingicoccus caecimuris]MCR1918847.1 biosynthetic-type acetolactate synthase large subunit [Frisingicoccus caecimuris]TCO84473.1 acetolactate synthase large subunit [Frisingicoccus caecimuris]